jgi:hypothetical protein
MTFLSTEVVAKSAQQSPHCAPRSNTHQVSHSSWLLSASRSIPFSRNPVKENDPAFRAEGHSLKTPNFESQPILED